MMQETPVTESRGFWGWGGVASGPTRRGWTSPAHHPPSTHTQFRNAVPEVSPLNLSGQLDIQKPCGMFYSRGSLRRSSTTAGAMSLASCTTTISAGTAGAGSDQYWLAEICAIARGPVEPILIHPGRLVNSDSTLWASCMYQYSVQLYEYEWGWLNSRAGFAHQMESRGHAANIHTCR